MPRILDIKFEHSEDGRKTLLALKGNDFVDVDNITKQKFLSIVEPLNLPNPEGACLLAHIIARAEVFDDRAIAEWLKPNERDEEIRRLFEMILSMKRLSEFECVKFGIKRRDEDKIQPFSFSDDFFKEEMIEAIAKCYIKHYTPIRCVKSYFEKGFGIRNMIQAEVTRLNDMKKFAKANLHHRPNTNRRNYAMLLLFFDVMKIEQCKANYIRIGEIFKLFGLWTDEQIAAPNSYKLIIRQWCTAQTYKLSFLPRDFPDKNVINGIPINGSKEGIIITIPKNENNVQ